MRARDTLVFVVLLFLGGGGFAYYRPPNFPIELGRNVVGYQVNGEITIAVYSINEPRNSGPVFARLPNGSILAAYAKCVSSSGGLTGGYDRIVGRVSNDEGQTWGEEFVVYDWPVRSDHVCAAFTYNNTVAIISVEWFGYPSGSTPAIITSSDGGLHWNKPTKVGYSPAPYTVPCVNVFQMSDGTWIMGASYDSDGNGRWHCCSYYCPSGIDPTNAQNWFCGGTIPGWDAHNLDEPAITELANGTLLALMRTNDYSGYLCYSTSSNHGRTWTKARFSPFRSLHSPCQLMKIESGRHILAWNPFLGNVQKSRNQLRVTVIDDNMRELSPSTVVSNDGNAACMPQFFLHPSKIALVGWWDYGGYVERPGGSGESTMCARLSPVFQSQLIHLGA